MLSGCGSQKESLSSREMQNLTAKFNILFNARTLVKESEQNIQAAYTTSFDQPISVFCEPSEALAKSELKNLDIAIKKANTVANEKAQSRFVDDAYLLIGIAQYLKADFYNAIEYMTYVYQTYPKEKDLKQAALVWRGRAYMQLGKFAEAKASLDTALKYLKTSKKMVAEAYASKAQWFIYSKDFSLAIPMLEKALKHSKLKSQRIRWTFLLAQLELRSKRKVQAFAHFNRIVKSNAPFEMSFNAQLNSLSIAEENAENKTDRVKLLKTLLKDDKNIDHLDQIYFQLGRTHEERKELSKAISNYQLSLRKNTRNATQKGLSYLALADLYFNQANYVLAKTYYDSTLTTLPMSHLDYENIRKKTSNLNILAKNLLIIAEEDSLQKLGKLSENELKEKLRALLEQKAKEAGIQKSKVAVTDVGGGLFSSQTSTDTKFYFNNSMALSQGFSDFKKRWGNRILADDWRRSQQALNTTPSAVVAPNTNATKNSNDDTQGIGIEDQLKILLFSIPNTADKVASSNLRIADAYYEIGTYYREVMQDQAAALHTFETILEKFPNYPNTAAVLYHVYRLSSETDPEKAVSYRTIIVDKYSNTVYAKVLADPEFSQKQDEQELALNRAYNQVFEQFEKKNFSEVLVCVQEVNSIFGENRLSPQLAYLKTIAEGYQEELAPFETSLKKIISSYPDDKLISPLVKSHLNFIDKNRKALALKLAVLTIKDPLVFAAEEPEPVKAVVAAAVQTNSGPFNLADSSRYYVAINLADGGANLSSSRFGIGQFNRANFPEGTIKHQVLVLGDSNQIIYIGEFNNQHHAQEYLNNVAPLLPDIIKVQASYTTFLITKANLEQVRSAELLTQYETYYKNTYNKTP